MGARRHAVLGEKTEGQQLGQQLSKKGRRHNLGQLMEKAPQILYDTVGALGQGFADGMEWTESGEGKALRGSSMTMVPLMGPQAAALTTAANLVTPALAQGTRALRRPTSNLYAQFNPKRQRR